MTSKKIPEVAPPAEPITIAKLDVNGVYFGVTTLDPANPPAVLVPVPAECDLQPGRYVWNAEHQRFDPLPDGQQLVKPGEITNEQAIYALALWAEEQGCFSQVVSQYISQFKSSIDGMGEPR